MLCVYLPAAFLTPLFGLLADRKAYRVKLMLLSQVIFLVAMIMFLLLPSLAIPGVVVLLVMTGCYQALFSGIFFPCLTLIVPQHQLGTALGVVNACQAVNMGLSPLVFGSLKDHTESFRLGYFYPLLFIVAQTLVCIGITLALDVYDRNSLHGLLDKGRPTQLSQFVISPHFVMRSKDRKRDLIDRAVQPGKPESGQHLIIK